MNLRDYRVAFDFTNDFLIERRTGVSGRLKKIICRIKGQARKRNIHELSGLGPMKLNIKR